MKGAGMLEGKEARAQKLNDLIEAGKRREASEFLRAHILGASTIKTPQVG